MKTRKQSIMLSVLILITCLLFIPDLKANAEGGDEYITITVDAEDDNEGLMYSIDSTEESAFTDSNTFTIPAGTSHTIYVKDAAGNITSQDYSPDYLYKPSPDISVTDENTQDINIDVELGKKDYSSILGNSSAAAEPGEGTMHDRTVTDGSDDGEKVFYTVTTAEGDTFYMVIDKNQNTDNVYLLNTVTRSDLTALAVDDKEEQEEKKEEDNLLTALQGEKETDTPVRTDSSEDSGISPKFIVLIIALIIGGAYYYLKIYKNKKEQQMDIMDAMDMEDFTAEEEDEEEDEAEFDMADDEKQAFLDNLINEDNDEERELYNTDPDDDTAGGDETVYANADNGMFADFETDFDPELDEEEE